MSNKKQLLREVVEYSDDSVKELYNYANQLDWMQVDQPDIFNEYLSDDKFMLSVFHQIREDSTLALEEELKQGWFDVLPFVYYDFFEIDQRYIKNIDELEKEINKLDKKKRQILKEGNQIPIQNEDKLEANKKSMSKISEEIIEKHGKIHRKYNIGVPYSIKELIFPKEEADKLLTGYKSEHRDSLITIREEYKNHLSKINKCLYRKVLQCSPQSSLDDIKGLLSWLVAGEYRSQNYLYFLDKDLLPNLESMEDAEIYKQFFKDLSADRRVGAETHFRIKLLDYVIRCKRRGDVSITIQGFNYLYADKPNSNAGYVPVNYANRSPFDRLKDGSTKQIIDLFVSHSKKPKVKPKNQEAVKDFLAMYEILIKNGIIEDPRNAAGSIKAVKQHEDFWHEGNLPSKRTLGKYIRKYLSNDYRGSEFLDK